MEHSHEITTTDINLFYFYYFLSKEKVEEYLVEIKCRLAQTKPYLSSFHTLITGSSSEGYVIQKLLILIY